MNQLHLSIDAQNDLADIKAYIAEDLENPQAAIATVSKITKAIHMLRDHALIGAPLSSVADVDGDDRFLVSGNYMVFFRANGSNTYIDRVLYRRRDYLRILFADTQSAANGTAFLLLAAYASFIEKSLEIIRFQGFSLVEISGIEPLTS